MKTVAILVALALVGCSTTDKVQEVAPPVPAMPAIVIDEQCMEYATYVRAVAVLRDMDVRIKLVNQILRNSPSKYPIDTIQRYVYSDVEYGPAAATNKAYNNCVREGFTKMMIRLNAEEVGFILIRQREESRLKMDTELPSPVVAPRKVKK